MSQNERLQGVIQWFRDDRGFGIILSDDGREYFLHMNNLPHGLIPHQGMRLSFQARPRPAGKRGMEAYNIAEISIGPSSDTSMSSNEPEFAPPPPSFHTPSQPHSRPKDVIREAAEEALRLRRERKRQSKAESNKPRKTRIPGFQFRAQSLEKLMRELSSDVKQKLTEEGWEDVDHIYVVKDEKPGEATAPLKIDPRVARAYRETTGISRFYSHQIQAREALINGRNIIIATPTASGKTEAFNPTIFETLIQNQQTTALYVFPLVALGLDQVQRLQKINTALPEKDRLLIGIYNSSVDAAEKRRTLRENNRMVVITPESLHYILLPKPYPNWKRFFHNLRYIVLDESHLYRGVLGANMANIVRRVIARSMREGNSQLPQIVISSATVAKPKQLARQLTGLKEESFQVIDRSGAPLARRHFLVTRTDIHDVESLCAELLSTTVMDARTHQERPVRMIVFLNSIASVKERTDSLRQHLRREREDSAIVEEYYSEKSDKTDVLMRLRQGEVRCLFTTNALMAGIDIGGLDVSIVQGFPRLVMDARQMFGRAGRAGEGAVIFIARPHDIFDQFYFERPDILLEGSTEDVIADPENPLLLAAHLQCAAQTTQDRYNREGPLSGEMTWLFGETGQDLLEIFVRKHILRIYRGNYYLEVGQPHDEPPLDNIRAMTTDQLTLLDIDSGRELERKNRTTAFRDAHPGAITWISGQRYQVLTLNQQDRLIECITTRTNLRTQGLEEVIITVKEIDPPVLNETQVLDGVLLQSGKVTVSTRVESYLVYQIKRVKQCRRRTCRYRSTDLDLQKCPKCGGPMRLRQEEEFQEKKTIDATPPLHTDLETRAAWLDISESLIDDFEREFWPRWLTEKEDNITILEPTPDHAIHSALHVILKAFSERLRCDQEEIAGTYELVRQNDVYARLYVYDNFPGGLGLADEFALEPEPILETALNIIERCTCTDDEGCPVCVARYGCKHFNHMLSKFAGRYLLRAILGMPTAPVIQELCDYVDLMPPSVQAPQPSPDFQPATASDTIFVSPSDLPF